MKLKPTKRGIEAFNYFAQCTDARSLWPVTLDEHGESALVCFHVKETYGGQLLPCREPELLIRALNGKKWHGLNVTEVAKDFAVDRLIFSKEIKENYPRWIANDIFGRAKQIALQIIGFVPGFVKNSKDFSEYEEIKLQTVI